MFPPTETEKINTPSDGGTSWQLGIAQGKQMMQVYKGLRSGLPHIPLVFLLLEKVRATVLIAMSGLVLSFIAPLGYLIFR